MEPQCPAMAGLSVLGRLAGPQEYPVYPWKHLEPLKLISLEPCPTINSSWTCLSPRLGLTGTHLQRLVLQWHCLQSEVVWGTTNKVGYPNLYFLAYAHPTFPPSLAVIRIIQTTPGITWCLKDSLRTQSTRPRAIWHHQSPAILLQWTLDFLMKLKQKRI